jgi:hypothetical protein
MEKQMLMPFLVYAQCEDDFVRIEMNYIELGRLSEIKGQSVLYNDLETRLIIDEKEAKNDYENKKLLKIIKCLCRRNQLLFIQNPQSNLFYYNISSLGIWTDGV